MTVPYYLIKESTTSETYSISVANLPAWNKFLNVVHLCISDQKKSTQVVLNKKKMGES